MELDRRSRKKDSNCNDVDKVMLGWLHAQWRRSSGSKDRRTLAGGVLTEGNNTDSYDRLSLDQQHQNN